MTIHDERTFSVGPAGVYRQLPRLKRDSTVAQLPCHDCTISPTTPGQIVAETFASHDNLPGIIVGIQDQIPGMISRSVFFQQLNRRAGG